jgi:glycosyltransferase involved in cell wall biosynthesis
MKPIQEVRVAYLVTHPIQYQAPLLKRIACEANISLKVFFASDFSVRGFQDPEFARRIQWDVPLLEGYEYEFLPTIRTHDHISFWQPLTYGLAHRFREGRFNVLWVHGYMRWPHWMAIATAKRLKMKILVRDEATAISMNRGPLKRIAKRAFFRCLSGLVDYFLAIGSLNADYYALNGVDRSRIVNVPYAVDNSFFQRAAAQYSGRREEFRKSLGLKSGRPIILYVGKLTARKCPDDLIEAYALLSRDGHQEPDPYLIFVGDGELRFTLEQRARELAWHSIVFVGFRNQQEIPAFYDLCDVFVIPSTLEPWGLVVNEAMNAGRAIVASDQVGCGPDLVHDGITGAIFKAKDSNGLAYVLRDILDDPLRCAKMGANALETISRWSFSEDLAGLRVALGLSG